MSEFYEKDESIHEPTTAHQHPLETTPQGSQADGAEGQHEHRDVSFPALAKWFTGLFIGIFFSFVLMWGFFHLVLNTAKSNDEIPSRTFSQRAELDHPWPDPRGESPLQKPNEMPILLPEPEEPMKKLRAEEDKTLSTYNWAKDAGGKKTGGVTMPIERAIELTVQRGLPADNKTSLRPAPAQAEVVRPGEVR
jgi:hypothetical protein